MLQSPKSWDTQDFVTARWSSGIVTAAMVTGCMLFAQFASAAVLPVTTDLELRLDASDDGSLTLSGSNVEAWEDSSVHMHSRSVSQGTGSLQPEAVPNASPNDL